MVKFDGGTTGTATGNSGDLPTMGCDASGLGVKLTTALGAGSWASNVFTLTTALSDYTLVMVGDLVTVDGLAYATVTSWTDNSGISTITTSAALTGTPLKRLRIITDSVECTVSDTAPLIASTWATTAMTADIVDASGGVVKHILLKSAGTASHADTANLAVGDQIHVVVDQATQQTLTVSRIGGAAGSTAGMVEIAETINLAAATGASVYRYGKGSKEKSVCSGRGLCDIGSGTCKCFKGYTMDDCSRQNTLAL
jgi:ribosomal protein L14